MVEATVDDATLTNLRDVVLQPDHVAAILIDVAQAQPAGEDIFGHLLMRNVDLAPARLPPLVDAPGRRARDGHAVDAELHVRLRAVDSETAARLHPEDRKRIIRALEVYQASGKSISQHQERSQAAGGRFHIAPSLSSPGP